MNPISINTFITFALKSIFAEAQQPGQITPANLNDALYQLNLIIDSWNADGKMIFAQQIQTWPLVGGQQSYEIGPTATDFVTPQRPSYLEFANYRLTTTFPNVDIPMRILSVDEWESIRVKNIQATVGFYVYLDEMWPNANLYVWPLPATGAELVLTSWSPLNSALVANSTISMPPAYARGLSLDLSISLAPMFGQAGSPGVALMASQLGKIKKDIGWVNLRGSRIQYSQEAQGARNSGTYDVITDSIL